MMNVAFLKKWSSCWRSSLLVLAIAGCGGGTPGTDPGPLKDKEAIAPLLPPGVTLESPIVPNPMFGASSITVADALASLQAYARDGAIHDGGLGSEVQFKRDGKVLGSGSAEKTKKKAKGAPTLTVIELAK